MQLDAELGEKVCAEAADLVRRSKKLNTVEYLKSLKNLPDWAQVDQVKRDLAGLNAGVPLGVNRTKPEQNRTGGIAGRYAAKNVLAPLVTETFDHFVKLVDEIEGMEIRALVMAAGKQRSVLGQRASGLAERMSEIMEALDE